MRTAAQIVGRGVAQSSKTRSQRHGAGFHRGARVADGLRQDAVHIAGGPVAFVALGAGTPSKKSRDPSAPRGRSPY